MKVVEYHKANYLAKKFRPVFIQEVKSVFDYLSPINLGEFLITDIPTIYFKVSEDKNFYYIFYMTYHYQDWSDWISFLKWADEHRHDNEGVLIAVDKQTNKVGWVCSRTHSHIDFSDNPEKVLGENSVVFKIEYGGHGITPEYDGSTLKENIMFYRNYKLVNMEKSKVKKWLWETVFPIFELQGASAPDTWNDSKIKREEGEKTDGLIWTNPAKLFILAKKHKLF